MIDRVKKARIGRNKAMDDIEPSKMKKDLPVIKSNQSVKKPKVEEKKERKASIIWKHRENDKSVFKCNTAFNYKDQISLYSHINYSLDYVTDKLKLKFRTQSNKWFFDSCHINIGVGSDTIVTELKKDGKECTFWDYCKRDSGGRLNIYMLTTPKVTDATLTQPIQVTHLPPFIQKYPTKTDDGIMSDITNANNVEDKPVMNVTSKLKSQKHDNSVSKNKVSSPYSIFKKPNPTEDNNKQARHLIPKLKSQKDDNSVSTTSSPALSIVNKPKPNKSSLYSVKQSKIPSSNFKMDLTRSLVDLSQDNTQSERDRQRSKIVSVSSSISSPVYCKCTGPAVSKQSIVPDKVSSANDHIELGIPQINVSELTPLEKVLGEGGQGQVRLGKWKKTEVAIKKILLKSDDLLVKREILMMDRIRHENFTNIMAISFDKCHAHLVMEYYQSYSLWDIIFVAKINDNFNLHETKKKTL